MTQPTTAPTTPSALLDHLQALLAAHRPAFRQTRTAARAHALLYGQLCAFGRHTITQSLLGLGLTDADWSAFYRLFSTPRFDDEMLNRCLLHETLAHSAPYQPYVAVVDGVQVPRSSRTMPGTSWLKAPRTPVFKPGIHRAQRFVHLAHLLPVEQGYSRAVPLRWAPAFPAKAVPGAADPQKEWEAGLVALQWLRAELDAASRADQRLLVLADSTYNTARLWAALPDRTTVLARCARNRALYQRPDSPGGRGRPRLYGARARRPHEWFAERTAWQQTVVAVRGRQIPLTYRDEGPYLVRGAPEQPLFLLVVHGVAQRRAERRLWRQREPQFFLVSAVERDGAWVLPFPAPVLLAWAWQRWEVEVAHRDLKSGWGLGEQQCWSPQGTVRSLQWQAWAYGVLVLAGYRTWGLCGHPTGPPGRWWRGARRWSFNTLWRALRQALWGTTEFRAVWAGSAPTWEKLETRLAGLDNAVAGSVRL
jgi:hypothetical protein